MILSLLATWTAALGAATPATTVELTFKPTKDWNVILPAEQFAAVAQGVTFPHAGGDVLGARLEGTTLWLDRDGDGTHDAKVEPLEPGQTSLMVFRPTDAAGEPCSYAVRLKSEGQWTYSASGAMVGELAGTRIQLIDQNNNGRFADYGEDAMIVGRGRAACFLSRVVNVDGALWTIDVAANGRRIEATPFDGETGTLDLGSKLDSKARVRALVVRSLDGRHSFELSAAKAGFRVPAGKYTIHSGRLALGKGHATLRPGKFQPVTVAADAPAVVAWGGPVTAKFRYARRGGELQIAPTDLRYHGRAGEEYVDFLPLGSSPAFVIKEANTGEVLVETKFPGNC